MFSQTEIYVIDDRVDWGVGKRGALWGPAIALHTFGEATMTSAATMVDNVIAKLGQGNHMDILRIVDHGNRSGLQLGDDWINSTSFARHARKLQELTPHFANSGVAHFVGCLIGNNVGLMHQFAVTWGVTVYGGTGLTNGFEVNGGQWVSVDPSGTTVRGTGWPD
jgi:hypothetical protein